jgi:hypothetical protein
MRRTDILLIILLGFMISPCKAEKNINQRSDCKFEILKGWDKYSVRWAGLCENGMANGSGVFRAYLNGRVSKVFYGKVVNGKAVIGVVGTKQWYMAGRVINGEVIVDEEPDVRPKTVSLAFDEAILGTRAASKYFKSTGNNASAKYYHDMEKTLSEQLD